MGFWKTGDDKPRWIALGDRITVAASVGVMVLVLPFLVVISVPRNRFGRVDWDFGAFVGGLLTGALGWACVLSTLAGFALLALRLAAWATEVGAKPSVPPGTQDLTLKPVDLANVPTEALQRALAKRAVAPAPARGLPPDPDRTPSPEELVARRVEEARRRVDLEERAAIQRKIDAARRRLEGDEG